VTRKNLLLIPIFFALFIIGVLFFYVVYAINTGTYLNREPVQRYYFEYDIKVTGLSYGNSLSVRQINFCTKNPPVYHRFSIL